MGKKTIVRVAEHVEMSELLLERLKAILGEFELERYTESPNLLRSYQRRIDSLEKAFLFILQTQPLKIEPPALKTYLDWCKKLCKLPPNGSIEDYQNVLSQYTALLTDAIVDYYDWPQEDGAEISMFSDRKAIAQKKLEEMKKIAIEQLNKAEQYVLMHEGRADLATLTPLKVSSQNEFVLQWDRQLPPYSEETVSELATIKALGLKWAKKKKTLTTPDWFRRLPLYQQAYFHGSDTQVNSIENLAIDLNKLLVIWLKLKTTASLQEELRRIAAGETNLPAWFRDLPANQQNLIRNLVSPTVTVSEVTNNLRALESRLQRMHASNSPEFNEELAELKTVPYWYLTLADYEQRFLNTVLNQVQRVEEAISFLPSRLRTLPILANFAEHQLLLLNQDGKVTKAFPAKLRSSHLASRDVAGQLHQVGELYTLRNLAKIRNIAANRMLLLQTLISPVKLLSGFMPDYTLEQHRQKAVETAKKEGAKLLFSTNHPFNMARVLYPTPATDPGCTALLQQAEAYSVLGQLPDLEGHWSYEQIEELVREAFASTYLVENKLQDDLTPSSFYILGPKSVKDNLAELFRTHYPALQQLPDWQKVVSQHLFIMHNHLESEHQTFVTYQQGLDDLTALAKEYRAVLNSPFGSGTILDYSGRELFLSSLENLLIMYMDGVSYGSCVSGKDRKAIEIIHTDAMLLYQELYGRWPGFTDTGAARKNFVKLVVELYLSRHGAEHAGQNAPGADSIKTPANYWPADIAEAICDRLGKKALTVDDIIATNNEVGKIGDAKARIAPNFAACAVAAQKLSKPNQKKLIEQIKIIVEEKEQWEKRTYSFPFYPAPPTGVDQIKQLLNVPGQYSSAHMTKTLAEIYEIVHQRPETSSTRDKVTQMLYDSILALFKHAEPEQICAQQIEHLITIKNEFFRENQQPIAVY